MIFQTVLVAKDHQQERRSRPRRKEKYVPVSITSVPKKAANNQKIYQVQIMPNQPKWFLWWGEWCWGQGRGFRWFVPLAQYPTASLSLNCWGTGQMRILKGKWKMPDANTWSAVWSSVCSQWLGGNLHRSTGDWWCLSNMSDVTQWTLSKRIHRILKWGEHSLHWRVLRHVNRLEKGAHRNLIELNKNKHRFASGVD